MSTLKKVFSFLLKVQNLYVIIPLLILTVVGYFLIEPFKIYLKEVINFSLVTIIALCIIYIIPFKSIIAKVLSVLVVILHLLILFKIGIYYIQGSRLNGTTYYLLFEAPQEEYVGFMRYYFDAFMCCAVASLILLLILFFRTLKKRKAAIESIVLFGNRSLFSLALVSIIGFSIYLIHIKLRDINTFSGIAWAYRDYTKSKRMIKADLSKPYSDYVKVKDTVYDKQVHIVIIGETISRRHMSLYDYSRDTNPILKAKQDEFYIFNDVISPNALTVLSLDKILTFSDFHNPRKKNNTSIIQLANGAGFETYWISNQQPVGIDETFATQLAYGADEKYFFAIGDYFRISYDGVMLPKLSEILKTNDKNKVIFIHLIGAHVPYESRYPESYSKFKDADVNDQLSTKQHDIVNSYDNAMLYNDFVIGSIIDDLKWLNIKSSLIYFSDHGEDVFASDNESFKGHADFGQTAPMFEIPFLVWFSDEFKTKEKEDLLRSSLNRKYNLEDFPHTFSDLLGIEHSLFDPEKSLINEKFKEGVRRVKIDDMEVVYDSIR